MGECVGFTGFSRGCGRNVLRGFIAAAKSPARYARDVKTLFRLIEHE